MCCVIMCDAVWTKCSTALTLALSMRSAEKKPKMFNSLKWITTDWVELCGSQRKNKIERNFSMSYACLAASTAVLPLSIQSTKNHFSSRECVRAKPSCVSPTATTHGNIHFEKLLFHLTAEQNIYMRYLCLNDSRINGCGNAVGSVLSFIIDSRAEPTCSYTTFLRVCRAQGNHAKKNTIEEYSLALNASS